MCPHGAAKSVLASAYFQRLAKERGLRAVAVLPGLSRTRASPRLWPGPI